MYFQIIIEIIFQEHLHVVVGLGDVLVNVVVDDASKQIRILATQPTKFFRQKIRACESYGYFMGKSPGFMFVFVDYGMVMGSSCQNLLLSTKVR